MSARDKAHNCPDCKCDPPDMQLGCGCPVGAHANDWDGWKAAHPEVHMGKRPDPNVGLYL